MERLKKAIEALEESTTRYNEQAEALPFVKGTKFYLEIKRNKVNIIVEKRRYPWAYYSALTKTKRARETEEEIAKTIENFLPEIEKERETLKKKQEREMQRQEESIQEIIEEAGWITLQSLDGEHQEIVIKPYRHPDKDIIEKATNKAIQRLKETAERKYTKRPFKEKRISINRKNIIVIRPSDQGKRKKRIEIWHIMIGGEGYYAQCKNQIVVSVSQELNYDYRKVWHFIQRVEKAIQWLETLPDR